MEKTLRVTMTIRDREGEDLEDGVKNQALVTVVCLQYHFI